MKLHNIAAIVLAGALAFSLSACEDKSDDNGIKVEEETSGTSVAGFDYNAGLTSDGFFENIKATDYVTLPQYKGVSIPSAVLTPDQTTLDQQIQSILSEHTEYEKVYDRAVENNDTINIDYVGKIDGVEFEGGSTKGAGTTVTIGVTSYIDDFLEQLIGHKPGETFDITVTFPDPYEPNTDLSGKDAVFTVTINYIQGEPLSGELTDEIAAEYGFDTKEALIADIEKWIVSNQKLTFFNDLVASAEYKEIPAAVYDYIKNEDIAYFDSMAGMYGMDVDTFINLYTGYESLDAFIETRTSIYESTAKTYLAVQAIAEQEGLKVTEEDVQNSQFAEYIDAYGMSYVKLYMLTNEVVPNFVIENGVVAD